MSTQSLPESEGMPGIDTISALIPFDYTMTSETVMADTESVSSSDAGSSIYNSTSSQSLDDATMTYFGTPVFKQDQNFNSFDSIPLQDMANVKQDTEGPVKQISSSDSDQENSACSSPENNHNVRLEVFPNGNSLLPLTKSCSFGEISIGMDQIDNDTLKIPPQVHIRLQRNTNNGFKETEGRDDLNKYIGTSHLEHSSSTPDLKSNKNRSRKPNLSKLKSRFQKSKSLPVLNVVPEEKENRLRPASPTDSSCDSLDNKKSPNGSQTPNRKRLFVRNKRPNSTHYSAIMAQYKKTVSFSLPNSSNTLTDNNGNADEGQTTNANPFPNTSNNNDNDNFNNKDSTMSSGSNRHTSESPIPSETSFLSNNRSTESAFDNTIKISKKAHFRGGQFCTLMRKFTTVLPRDEIAQMSVVVKDSTDVHPLDNGGAIVTDILSNKMVLFDDMGYPKVTFAMENGSEPWSIAVTPDNGSMAATLKGEGCVCLWSLNGESQTDFGQGILASPTGICLDHQGRFVVSDEGKNSVYLFSRTGNFIREFIKQDSLNPFAGNKAMESLNQPRYVCVSRDGLYFVSDSSNQIVKIFDETGSILKVIGSYGRDDGQFRFPYGVAFDEETRLLYVADHFNHRVSVFSLNGTFLYHILTQSDGITRPKGLAIRGSRLIVTFGDMRAGNVNVYRIHANQDG